MSFYAFYETDYRTASSYSPFKSVITSQALVQPRQDFHIPLMYCKLPTTLSNNMNNIWEVNSINLLLSWKILGADSVCFVSSFRPAWGCV